MPNVGYGTWFPKRPSTKFVVKNVARKGKRVRVFNYPINNGDTRDLLAIPEVSEADIRHSLLKGELQIKLDPNIRELIVVESDIDLLQFNDDHKLFLQSVGIIKGLEITGEQSNHSILRQLIHFIDEGPGDGFASGSYKVITNQPFPSSIIWYTDTTQSRKIVEKLITYTSNSLPAIVVWHMYAEDGVTITHTVTDTLTYIDNAFESTRVRTIS